MITKELILRLSKNMNSLVHIWSCFGSKHGQKFCIILHKPIKNINGFTTEIVDTITLNYIDKQGKIKHIKYKESGNLYNLNDDEILRCCKEDNYTSLDISKFKVDLHNRSKLMTCERIITKLATSYQNNIIIISNVNVNKSEDDRYVFNYDLIIDEYFVPKF